MEMQEPLLEVIKVLRYSKFSSFSLGQPRNQRSTRKEMAQGSE